MFSSLVNWRTILSAVAIVIVTGTIFYSNYLSRKIAADEKKKVKIWAESLKTKSITNDESALNLTNLISIENDDIPIIETDEKDNPTGNYLNIEDELIKNEPGFLKKKVEEFKKQHEKIIVEIVPNTRLFYYFGDSTLQKEVKYYPIVQLVIVGLFIIITLITISTRNKSTQNQVWAGMAKETAHQLGTPISSLEGWLEILKEVPGNAKITPEISKDIERLKLVSDRFGKIGSKPQLESVNIIHQLEQMIGYIKKRSTDKVNFLINHFESTDLKIMINAPLFDWVTENLYKNALDALDGQGTITTSIINNPGNIFIDITDTGKGISKKNMGNVFKPGFTTKKRGWGLGLSLSKRIIEHYHKGQLFVKSSEPGKGTTFRIVLKK
jgi:signal transduction histidine kinase